MYLDTALIKYDYMYFHMKVECFFWMIQLDVFGIIKLSVDG